jgi:GDP-L-fucose synthase
MMSTLVTGGTGLVGSNLREIMPEAIYISSKEYNLVNSSETIDMIKEYQPKTVVHLAARVGGLGGNMNHKGEFFYENTMINTNVLEACRLGRVEKVVSFLSTCIFPDRVEYPLTEKKIHLGPPHNSNYPYAYTKRMLDIQSRAYRDQYGVNYVCLVPTNIYGPFDNFSIENGHVIPSLIHKCYLAKVNNTSFSVWGTGSPLREFIFAKDIAKLTKWAIQHYEDEEPLILSSSPEVSIRDVVELIAKCMNFKGDILWDSSKPDGQYRKPTNTSKLDSYYPEFKYTQLNLGIEETVTWFCKNYKEIRK